MLVRVTSWIVLFVLTKKPDPLKLPVPLSPTRTSLSSLEPF